MALLDCKRQWGAEPEPPLEGTDHPQHPYKVYQGLKDTIRAVTDLIGTAVGSASTMTPVDPQDVRTWVDARLYTLASTLCADTRAREYKLPAHGPNYVIIMEAIHEVLAMKMDLGAYPSLDVVKANGHPAAVQMIMNARGMEYANELRVEEARGPSCGDLANLAKVTLQP
jgi:hypothetical protein